MSYFRKGFKFNLPVVKTVANSVQLVKYNFLSGPHRAGFWNFLVVNSRSILSCYSMAATALAINQIIVVASEDHTVNFTEWGYNLLQSYYPNMYSD